MWINFSFYSEAFPFLLKNFFSRRNPFRFVFSVWRLSISKKRKIWGLKTEEPLFSQSYRFERKTHITKNSLLVLVLSSFFLFFHINFMFCHPFCINFFHHLEHNFTLFSRLICFHILLFCSIWLIKFVDWLLNDFRNYSLLKLHKKKCDANEEMRVNG